jgi:hypothetical protein
MLQGTMERASAVGVDRLVGTHREAVWCISGSARQELLIVCWINAKMLKSGENLPVNTSTGAIMV